MEASLPSPTTTVTATIDLKSTDPQEIQQQKGTRLRNKSRKGSMSIVSKESKSSSPYSTNKNTIAREKKQRQQNENLPKSPIQIQSKISNSNKKEECISIPDADKQEFDHLIDIKKNTNDYDNSTAAMNSPQSQQQHNTDSTSQPVDADSTPTPNNIANDFSKSEQSQLLTPPELFEDIPPEFLEQVRLLEEEERARRKYYEDYLHVDMDF
ncbi:11348_t:CDS:2 [Ambispora gerdemannii]|uniref:11348_t:CDS:1 n=1 Tax=Ambispora gerdemannii TaxID=144530 RepID=A0A9N9AMN0_9GLOM|nr:11348_t:CDS:2 [Ambispora gerdemannii]